MNHLIHEHVLLHMSIYSDDMIIFVYNMYMRYKITMDVCMAGSIYTISIGFVIMISYCFPPFILLL